MQGLPEDNANLQDPGRGFITGLIYALLAGTGGSDVRMVRLVNGALRSRK